MGSDRDQVFRRIESEWTQLQELIARVPAELMEGAQVVGTWSVKDLLGHIATWEAEAMGNIERFLDAGLGEMRTYDVDEFNEQTTQAKRRLFLEEVTRDLAETHARLLVFLRDLPESAFHSESVPRRIRLDTYEHYLEHAETLRGWLHSVRA